MTAPIMRQQYSVSTRPIRHSRVERHAVLFASAIVLLWSVTLLYFMCNVLLAQKIIFFANKVEPGPVHKGRYSLAILAEILLSFQELILAFGLLTTLCSFGRQPPRPSYEIVGQSAPTIDVFVTCCGEALDIVLDTVKAAASQNYPSSKFRVLVLDDGRDEELHQQIQHLEPWTKERGFAQVLYNARTLKKGAKSFFKAGNLNFGLSEAAGNPPSEYFAALDCDMIPEPYWLRRSVGHLILDDKLAMTVAPQNYYNVPPGDPLGQQADFSMYFAVQEVLNDSVGACMCTGTGYVARRKAIEDIGGWPLAESGEDYMCSAYLANAGWNIAYVREPVQWGLCPESMRVLLKQRMRWTDAAIEVFKQFRFYLRKTDLTATMTISQRLVNLLYVMRDYSPVTNLLAMAMLPWVIYPTSSTENFGQQLHESHRSLLESLRYLLPLSWACNKLFYFIIYSHLSLSHIWNFQSNEIWAAPYMAYRCLLSVLPSSFLKPSFAVCGSFPSSERSVHSRPALLTRLLNTNTLLWISYIIYAAIPLSAVLFTVDNAGVGLFVPGAVLKLVTVILKMSVPVRYMIFPPMMPDRETMLVVDEMGIRRVKEEWKGRAEKDRDLELWACVAGVELMALAILLAKG